MKKVFLAVLIGLGTWSYFDKRSATNFGGEKAITKEFEVAEAYPGTSVPQTFNCDGRVYCSEMTSRAEAEYFSSYCSGTKMDGDHDGVPCENDSRF